MSESALVYPMAAMVFYTWALAIYNFIVRFGAVKRGEVSGRYFKSFTEGKFTERVVIVGRHYDHQFQLPTWFLVSCAAALALGQVNTFLVGCAWAFVAVRLLHSCVHLGWNHPLHRAGVFALGWLSLGLLWIELLLSLRGA